MIKLENIMIHHSACIVMSRIMSALASMSLCFRKLNYNSLHLISFSFPHPAHESPGRELVCNQSLFQCLNVNNHRNTISTDIPGGHSYYPTVSRAVGEYSRGRTLVLLSFEVVCETQSFLFDV